MNIIKKNQQRAENVLANMPPAIAAMFTIGESKEQEANRKRKHEITMKFLNATSEYRKTHNAEMPQNECEALWKMLNAS